MCKTEVDIALDVAAIGRIACIPELLRVACRTTNMGFAGVARVTGESWTACAVEDNIDLGLRPGGQLDIHTTLCLEARNLRAPVVIDHASVDPVYATHHTPRIYGIESYISVPIVLADDSYFGNLFAIDRFPARPSRPEIVSMFKLFASLIAMHLNEERARHAHAQALLDEMATGEMREHFIAMLGHDLRTPLSAVSSTAHLLRRTSSDPQVVELAERIQSSSTRMATLIDNVLDLAKGKLGGGIAIHAANVEDLGQAIRDVVSEVQCAHPSRHIEASINIDVGVRCDRSRIQQLVSNLLSNAVAYGASDAPVVLSAEAVGDEVTITVRNTGEPISVEDQAKVFQPFWRGGSGNGGGLGLGLFICSEIVKAHVGSLEVTSSAETGTIFRARLPGIPGSHVPATNASREEATGS
ncbi:ATP-binding protein [Rhizobacter sp. Root404]|uniref:GAF domain-containing sensor histidine kinase n=1 Tax=Rhizobacter sp. Root404 TaxID=1736528 RepID=UPI003528BDF7